MGSAQPLFSQHSATLCTAVFLVLTGLWSAKLQNTEFSIKMSGVDTSSSSVPSVETQDNSCDNKMSETVKEYSPPLENKETENVPETECKENNEIDNAN